MKSMRNMIFGALALVALYCVVRVLLPGHERPPSAGPSSTGVQRETRSARPRQAVHPTELRPATALIRPQLSSDERSMPPLIMSEVEPAKAEAQAVAAGTSEKEEVPTPVKAPGAVGIAAAPGSGKPPIQDPMARAALAYVGADPDAESYWYEAINDPSLGPQERQDLIEDLNEDGLSDPHNPTADDLPLILNRIQLIEEVVWDAMDEVNADAFLEAYKDLVNLAFQAMGNG